MTKITLIAALLWAAPAAAQLADGLYAEIRTPKGLIVLQLEFERTPMTVANFVGLAEGTLENDAFDLGRPFFDGSRFQRVVPGHVIQGGGADSERSGSSGRRIPNEIHPDLSHDHAGAVGMANGGPHTATNQFYITLGDRSYLDGDYAVFGEVVEGMDVVMSIVADDAIQSVRIVRVGNAAEAFRPTPDSFAQLVSRVEEQVRVQDEARRRTEERFVRTNWPDARSSGSGWQYVVVQEGSGATPEPGDSLTVHYTARSAFGLEFAAVGDDGQPGWPEAARPFSFVVGATSINPGFDEAVARMKPGEKWVVILPAAVAYGRSGYYGRSDPGRPRFHVSPNTMLVYEIQAEPAVRR